MSGATARRAPSRPDPASLARAVRPGRLAAAFLLAAFAGLSATPAAAVDLWAAHVGTDDGEAPRIVSIERYQAPEHTRNRDHNFLVTFSEPVARLDTGDFDAHGASDEWWRVWGVEETRAERDSESRREFLKACNLDHDLINEHLRDARGRLDLRSDLRRECERRRDMWRQYIVEVGSREIRDGRVRTVSLHLMAGQDVEDAWGNRLDATLPTGGDYETFFVDRQAPRPVVTVGTGCCGSEAGSPIDSHQGPGPLNAFWMTADFGEPVSGLLCSEIRIIGGAANGCWGGRHYDGDSSYSMSVYPTGTGDMVIEVPARGAQDRAGNGNLTSNRIVLPFRGAAFGLETPPNRIFTADHPLTGVTLPAASGGGGSFTYALAPRGGGSLPAGLSFSASTRTISGTPTTAAGAVTLDYTATDGNGIARTVSFTVAVRAALALATPEDRTFQPGRTIGGFRLPHATGGTGQLRYELNGLPRNLRWSGGTFVSGRPRSPGVSTVTWKVTDANGATVSRQFTITVIPPAVSFTPFTPTVPEGGSTSYTISLQSRPTSNVVIAVTAGSGDSDITVSGPSSVTFTPSNWQTARTITLAAAVDNDCSASTRSIVHTITTNDPGFGDLGSPAIAAREGDDDTDCTAPRVRSVERTGAAETAGRQGHTNADTLQFRVTFSESVRNVTADDFNASGTTGDATAVTGTGAVYTVTVSGGNLNDLDGDVRLTFASNQDIEDLAASANVGRGANALALTAPTGANERYTVDNTAPTAVLARADGQTGTLNAAFDVTVTFTEANGLRTSGAGSFRPHTDTDLVVANGSVASRSGGPLVHTVGIAPDAGVMGNVTVDLPAGGVLDLAGNGNTAATRLTVPFDNSPATVASITRHSGTMSGANGQTNADSLTFEVTFSEDVENVDAADFNASGTTGDATGTVTGSGDTWVVTVSGGDLNNLNGTVGLTLDATNHDIVDAGGNALAGTTPTGANQTYTVDNIRPTVTLARADGAGTTLAGAFDVTVTFTEANGLATGGTGAFAAGDLDVTNGSATSVTATTNPLVWTARVTPTTGFTGNVLVDLPANAVRDAAGNGNEAATELSVPVDNGAPRVSRIERHDGTNAQDELTDDDSLTFRVTFNENVRNVDAADFNASGAGDATGVTPASGTGSVFIVTVSGGTLGSHDGKVGLTFASTPTRNIQDAAGNALDATLPTGTNYETYTLDNTAPRIVSLTRDDGNGNDPGQITNANSVQFRVMFNEDVRNVDTGDFAPVFVNDLSRTASVSVTGDEDEYVVTVSGGDLADYDGLLLLTSGSGLDIEDLAGNDGINFNLIATEQRYTFDNTRPTVTLARADGLTTTLSGAFDVTVTFTEANGLQAGSFTAGDLTVDNGSATLAATTDPLVWTATVTPTSGFTGDVTVDLAADAVLDAAGNGNSAAATLTVPVDNAAPTMTSIARSSPATARTNANTLVWRVTFSEAVSVAAGAFNVAPAYSGATVAATAVSDDPGTAWDVTLSGGTALAGGTGAVGLTLADASKITDAGGNALTGGVPGGTNYETYTLDNDAPTPALSAVPATHDGTTPTVVTVDFGEGVNDFVSADIGVTGGAKSNFTGSPGDSSYTVTVTPTPGSTADILVSVNADVATDLAGNPNLASSPSPLSVTYTQELSLTGPGNLTFTATQAISVPALAQATGGTGAITYALTGASGGALPTWLTFTPATRVMSGTPQTAAAAVTLEYTATDDNNTPADMSDDTTTDPVTFTVTVVTVDTTLSGLTLTAPDGTTLALDPVFASATETYEATAPSDVASVTVAATASDTDATVAFDPATDADTNTAGHQVTLAEGENTIEATVTNDTLTRDYTITVTRESPATLSLSSSAYTFGENDFSGFVTVTVDNAVSGGFTVQPTLTRTHRAQDVKVSADTNLGSLTFAGTAGQSRTFQVDLFDDNLAELDETYDLTLSASLDSIDDSATATVTVTDDEAAPTLSVADATATEGEDMEFAVSLSGAYVGPVVVTATFTNGTAGAADYESAQQTITFAAQETSKTLTVGTTADDTTEGDETFTVTLTADVDRIVDTSVTATGTISEGLALTGPGNQVFTATRAISVDPLPEATGAEGSVTYALTGASGANLPSWLTFTAGTRTMSGTPQAAATAVTLEYTATDDSGTSSDASDDVTTDPVTFTVTVNAAPALADVDDQSWPVDTAITALSLPEATLGTGPFTYELEGPSGGALPAGLTFNKDARPPTITGTPSTAASAVTLTYTATDANGAEVETEFDVTVRAPAADAVIWSATLTVGEHSSQTEAGFYSTAGAYYGGNDGGLSVTEFALEGGAKATVTEFKWASLSGNAAFGRVNFEATLPAMYTGDDDWTLHIGGASEAFSDTDFDDDMGLWQWNGFLSTLPAIGSTVRVCITTGNASCPAADTTLSTLGLTDGSGTAVALDQTFAAGTTEYTASVANDVDTVTVAATANAASGVVAFDPADDDTSTAGHQVDLDVGSNNTITVTVADGSSSRDYTITVTREADAAVIWAARLGVDLATLPDYVGYEFGTSSDGLTPRSFTAPGGGEITVDHLQWNSTELIFLSDKLPSGHGSWTLHVGDAKKDLSDDVTTDTSDATNTDLAWTDFFSGTTAPALGSKADVCLTRGGAACVVPDTTTLSALTVTDANGNELTFHQAFEADSYSLGTLVASSVTQVTLTATASDTNATVTFDVADADPSTPGLQVNVPLAGAQIIVTVTNGAASEIYVVFVNRRDTTLSALSLTDGSGNAVTLDPTFSGGTREYTASVANSVSAVTVAATANDSTNATVAFTPADADASTTGHQVSLTEDGTTEITATVTNDGVSDDYTITVTREAAPPATDAFWSARLEVKEASSNNGYCQSDCEKFSTDGADPNNGYGAFVEMTTGMFTIPDTSDSATVTAIAWEDGRSVVPDGSLFLRISGLPAKSVYDGWTLTVNGVSVALSENDGFVTDRGGTLTDDTLYFEDFFGSGSAPSVNTTIDVSLAESDDGGAAAQPEIIWSARSTVGYGTATLYGFNQLSGTLLAGAPLANQSTIRWETSGSDKGDLYYVMHEPLPDGYEAWTLQLDYGTTTETASFGDAGVSANERTYTFADFFSGEPPQSGAMTLTVCVPPEGSDSCAVSASSTEPFWSATLTVRGGSGNNGYCPFNPSCPIHDEGMPATTDLSPHSFIAPGTGDRVVVRAVAWPNSSGATSLRLMLDPLPEATVFGAWFLTVNDIEVDLSDNTGVSQVNPSDAADSIQFSNFFSTANPAPGIGDVINVCLSSDGTDCPAVSATAGTEAPSSGLQARFGAQPAWHTGMPFWTELHFSEEPDVGYKDLRDKAFEVTGGRITRAQRIDKGSKRSWRLQVVPDGFGDVSLTLPATEDCEAEGAVCTAEGERLETGLALAVPGPGDRLAARLKGTSSHDGEPFFLKLHFNHEPNLGYRDVRDKLFAVTGARIARAQRLERGSNLGWRLTVEPEDVGAVGLELPATESCSAAGAVCTRDGRKLERGIAWTVAGPAAFSVSDAEANEDAGAALAFEVSLSRRLRAEARVDVATQDGTATAGSDYEAVSQTLVFAPGETLKVVEVPVLDDAHDEGSETMTLVLSNAQGAPIADAKGTGTIVNSDAIPQAWLARFGRTVTGQVLDAVEERLTAPRRAGMRATLGGQALPSWDGQSGHAKTMAQTGTPGPGTGIGGATPGMGAVAANDNDGTGDGAVGSAPAGTALAVADSGNDSASELAALAALRDWMAHADAGADRTGSGFGVEGGQRTRTVSGRELLLGTSFALTAGSAEGGGHASLWGRVSVAGFNGREDALSLDGQVTTGLLGADWAAERWTAGLALGHSMGTGGYRNSDCEAAPGSEAGVGSDRPGGCGGRIEAELTGLYPYAGLDLTERVSVWLAAGHGAGELTVVPDGQGAVATDMTMSMGAAGTRIALLKPEGEGLRLALKSDGRFTRTSSDAARAPDGGNLAAAEADVWLLRVGLEGSRPIALGTGDDAASLTPAFELGVRRDGGDAETGFGADMGGGVALADPQHGLRLDLKARALVAHEASGFREWGASAGFGWDPAPSTDRGLAMSLRQSWGASPSGGMDGLLNRETMAGLAANDDGSGRFEASSRLSGEVGYGLSAFGGGFTGTPNLGFGMSSGGARDWRLGWRLTPAAPSGVDFSVDLDATRRESANDDARHGVALRGTLRW